MLRDGEKFDFNSLTIEENYDLIVVGAGISGYVRLVFIKTKQEIRKNLNS